MWGRRTFHEGLAQVNADEVKEGQHDGDPGGGHQRPVFHTRILSTHTHTHTPREGRRVGERKKHQRDRRSVATLGVHTPACVNTPPVRVWHQINLTTVQKEKQNSQELLARVPVLHTCTTAHMRTHTHTGDRRQQTTWQPRCAGNGRQHPARHDT